MPLILRSVLYIFKIQYKSPLNKLNPSSLQPLHTFCFLSDIQFGLYEYFINRLQHWSDPIPPEQFLAQEDIRLRNFDASNIAQRETILFAETIDMINHIQPRPDFLVHGGDMTHDAFQTENLDTYQSIISSCVIQDHIYIPGNHDI